MNRKHLIAAALAAGSLMGLASVAQAVPAVVATPGTYSSGPTVYGYPGQAVVVQSTPPAPIYESVPTPREGYIWAPGHYQLRNGQYVWTGGEWMATRPGYAWQAAHWEQRTDGSWYLVGGTWVRTDSYATNNSEARRGPWGDRDGDGVINRDDRYPRDYGRY